MAVHRSGRYWKVEHNWKPHLEGCVNSSSDRRYRERFGYASIVRRQKWDAPFLLPTSQPTTGPPPTDPPAAPPTSTYPLTNLTELPA